MSKTTLKIILIVTLASINSYATVSKAEIRKLKKEIIEESIPNCLNVTSHYDSVYCSGKIYNILDDKLNGIYKTLVKKISKSQKKELKTVQRKWIRTRDDNCATSDSAGIIVNLTCSIQSTVESLYYLREMNRNLKDFDKLLTEYKTLK
jgi:uncharacterized protein YecT (DUF1311 family)